MAKDKKNKQQLKNPKGTRDWSGEDVALLKDILRQISTVFRKHGGQELDTPVFELQEVLKGKYGEDSKLIYDVADQGGELLSLRYDLTVPFARWLAMNPNSDTDNRFAIGKVYRRDQPAIAKGRMREFWQCDIDFNGPSDPMAVDSEILAIVCEVFDALEWKGQYTIKINDRRILDGLFEVCGVPTDKLRAISSAVDKLDKSPWSEVRKEMVETKGLDPDVADRIEKYVTMKGGKGDSQTASALLETLKADDKLMSNPKAKEGITSFEKLMSYLEAWKTLDQISFDLSLARGLDYYTGIIYEVITEGSRPTNLPLNGTKKSDEEKKDTKKAKNIADEDEDRSNDPTIGVGSIAAGGRYDNLVSRFSEKSEIPCVGVSFGVDRIFSITKSRLSQGQKFTYVTSTSTDVFVMAFGGKDFDGALKERYAVIKTLGEAGISAKTMHKEKAKLPAQFKKADSKGARIGVILGEDEIRNGQVKVKIMGLTDDSDPRKEGILIPRGDLVKEVSGMLRELDGGEVEGVTKQMEGLGVDAGTRQKVTLTEEQRKEIIEKLSKGETVEVGGVQIS
ncbi:Cytoplasmic and mitochondrial histidine tRNA synthetase [Lithohypha guttulata]|uniref:Cytoplasmic and mitochondrial histidine tRNA synthetase n=1 Tax=Lithohypha guttulata TaxID=1690604 RepID=UPI002DE09151|nr:Cytoplasmic and mitochondrial histidine tRNA synthetase [Lithohypha guttulata]